MKTLVIVFAVIIVILLGILAFYNPAKGPVTPLGAGSASSPDGHVTVVSPKPNSSVSSPIAVQGTVVGGGWFNEATFPVKIVDANGNVIGRGVAQAQSPAEWTSTGTVPFLASIPFTDPATATGTVVFSKDNPSGLPANDESFSVPIVFAHAQ